ncbi:MAG: hypothetical protein FWC50_08640 [Planctomycetaceae bacterium]|nr:hypothetical protein [Planctomycetaceae bacterium]
MRYVLLKHEKYNDFHVDFLLDCGAERLLTWQFSDKKLLQFFPMDANFLDIPVSPNHTIDKIKIIARRIFDHRRRYLEFEGEIAPQQGSVTRIEQGEWELVSLDDQQLTINTASRNTAKCHFAKSGQIWVFHFPRKTICPCHDFHPWELGKRIPEPNNDIWDVFVQQHNYD